MGYLPSLYVAKRQAQNTHGLKDNRLNNKKQKVLVLNYLIYKLFRGMTKSSKYQQLFFWFFSSGRLFEKYQSVFRYLKVDKFAKYGLWKQSLHHTLAR